LIKHDIFGLFGKVFKINFKSKTKVENDLEIKKIPKYQILEFLVKHDIFGFFAFPKSFQN
jgi:hypothetical protein